MIGISGASAQTCDVPASRPTIQAAVDDVACAEVALAIATYVEDVSIGRSVLVRSAAGGTAVIAGVVTVSGVGTLATLEQLEIDTTTMACSAAGSALEAVGDAEVEMHSVVTRTGDPGACPLFSDGFELGDLGGWS